MGLPSAPPDPRFGTVTEYGSSDYSNYDGFVVRLNHSFSKGLLFQINYSWSHALDVCSNGCLESIQSRYGCEYSEPAKSVQRPHELRQRDYDVRHYFSANYVWDECDPRFSHWGPKPHFRRVDHLGDVVRAQRFPAHRRGHRRFEHPERL